MTEITELNNLYKLESLGMLPDYCLQEIFSREFSNIDTALITAILSKESGIKVLSNINAVRSEKISVIVDRFNKGILDISSARFEKSCEALMDRVQELKNNGLIKIPQVSVDADFFNQDEELHHYTDALPNFDFQYMDLHEVISWWDLAAKSIKSVFGKRTQIENIILERLKDDFSSMLFASSIDDIHDMKIVDIEERLRNDTIEDCRKRLDMSESFLMSLGGKTSRQLASDLALHFPDQPDFINRLTRLGPLLLVPTVKHNLPLEEIAIRLYKLKLIHDEQGADEMLKFAGRIEDHFFRRGLAVVLSGMDFNFAQRIIKERRKAQLDETIIKLKMISDAVMCIRHRTSGYIMLELMSSYTVYDFEE